ncbi:MAG: SH3 domain-containing protein [Desulfobacterales bacterium]|nr:SH3 domain-containing protein [Desulfobacterales bacterium]
MWVYSSGAKLRANKSISSSVVVSLPIGTTLNILSAEDKWYLVFTDAGEQGWIYRGMVSEVPPETDNAELNDGKFVIELAESSIQFEESYTARSVRSSPSTIESKEHGNKNLSEIANEYAKKADISNEFQNALAGVLELTANGDEIEFFLKNGRIGEYCK